MIQVEIVDQVLIKIHKALSGLYSSHVFEWVEKNCLSEYENIGNQLDTAILNFQNSSITQRELDACATQYVIKHTNWMMRYRNAAMRRAS